MSANIYQLLRPKNYDENTTRNHKMIIQYYQTIPKYYLLSSNENVIICNMMTGSGKTLLGVFAFLQWFNSIRIFDFNRQFVASSVFDGLTVGNIFVVGPWVTSYNIIKTLLNPILGFIDENTAEILRKEFSKIEEERKQAADMRKKLIKRIKKYVNFYGYQSFFNDCFSDSLKNNELIQNIDSLISMYRQEKIKLNAEMEKRLKNSIIIVDEMQNLYSYNGLNSYGFCFMFLSNIAKKYNLKIIFMTGTIFNTSPSEIIDVLNITNTAGEFLRYGDFLESVAIVDDVKDYKIRPEKLNDLLERYFYKYIYYNPSAKNNEREKPKIMHADKTGFFVAHDENNLKCIIFNELPNLCKVIYVGSTIIADENSPNPLILYRNICEGYQAQNYRKYVEKNLHLTGDDKPEKRRRTTGGDISNDQQPDEIAEDIKTRDSRENDDENAVLIQDAYIPKKDRIKHGIIESNGVFIGNFLEREKIKNYSIIAFNFLNLVTENIKHGEKSIIYHNKIKHFGIIQYGKILEYNGWFEWNKKPKDSSTCKNCGKNYVSHSLPIKDRIARKVCNHFTGLKFAILTGEINQKDREEILIEFNSLTNLYGDKIAAIFISNVAYSGVSFLNTTNLILLSRISDMTKWKQIVARIVRMKGHVRLPKNKQVAKIYTFVVNLPDEIETYKKLTKFTISERYYLVNTTLNNNIEDFLKILSKKCIGHYLFEKPEELRFEKEEKRRLKTLFYDDVKQHFETVIKRIFVDNYTNIWKFNTLIERIKNNKYTPFFFDISTIPKAKIIEILTAVRSVEIVRPIGLEFSENNTFIKLKNTTTQKNNDFYTEFNFSAIENATSDPNALIKLLEQIKKERQNPKTFNKIHNLKNILQNILRFISKRFYLLTDKPEFWDAIYDIHDEYYKNDETEFFVNHYSKNRNRQNVAGFYFGDYVVFTDGSSKLIDYTYPAVNMFLDGVFKFKILSNITQANSRFYLHVMVIRKQDEKHEDLRKLIKGIDCNSYKNFPELVKHFPEIKETYKKGFCHELMNVLIDRQHKTKEKIIFSPFEK